MNNNQHGSEHSSEQGTLLAQMAELRAQVEQLQQVVRDLEEQKKKDAQAMAEAQAELEEYRRMVYKWAAKHVREEDWKDFKEEDYTITVEEVLAELEKWEQQ